MKTTIIIPTYNAEPYLEQLLPALKMQVGVMPNDFHIIDSSSTDNTRQAFKDFGARVQKIDQCEFGHGKTRTFAADLHKDSDILIYMTQDAIPNNMNTIQNLIATFNNASVSLAFGRQLPRNGAGHIESHGRLYNYGTQSYIASFKDKDHMGIKTFFCSNSFAAYRRTSLENIGFFPEEINFSEDQVVAAKMLLASGEIAYAANATVKHSHDLTIKEEWERYKMIGATYKDQRGLFGQFGRSEKSGLSFVLSEFNYLIKKAPWLIPESFLRTLVKYCAYKITANKND